jgi:hypothetical protein
MKKRLASRAEMPGATHDFNDEAKGASKIKIRLVAAFPAVDPFSALLLQISLDLIKPIAHIERDGIGSRPVLLSQEPTPWSSATNGLD